MSKSAIRVSGETKKEFYSKMDDLRLVPFWEIKKKLVTMEPETETQPFIWYMDEIRDTLLRSGDYVDVKAAERRGLMLENPGLRGTAAITKSILATFQLITPGEIEDAHRHVASAWRFIIEGTGAHTAVDGERCYLSPGDVVVTPSMSWHEHGNETDSPVFWIDGLDIPLVNHFGASFKGIIDGPHAVTRPVGYGQSRYASGVLPANDGAAREASPLMHYPYERVRAAIDQLRDVEEMDPSHGVRVRYANPTTGGHVFPTMGLHLQSIPKGFQAQPYRSTDEVICVVHEGRGSTMIGDTEIQWGPKDTFVIPSWHFHRHKPATDAIIFTASDMPAQQKLGFWQEQRGNDAVPFS